MKGDIRFALALAITPSHNRLYIICVKYGIS